MSGRAVRTRRQRCVTCRPSEWRAIRARARAAGMDVSAYILSRVLDGAAPDGPPHPEAGYPMALTAAEQRRQLEILDRCVAACGPLTQAALVKGHGMTVGQALDFVTLSLDAGGTVPKGRSREGPRTRPDPEPAARTANVPGAGKPTDGRARQADLFGSPGAGPSSGDGAPPRDLLDDLVDELNRDGGP